MQKKGLIWIFIVVIVAAIVMALLVGGRKEIGEELNRAGADLGAINVDGIDTNFEQNPDSLTPSNTTNTEVSGTPNTQSDSDDLQAELSSIESELDSSNTDSIDTTF